MIQWINVIKMPSHHSAFYSFSLIVRCYICSSPFPPIYPGCSLVIKLFGSCKHLHIDHTREEISDSCLRYLYTNAHAHFSYYPKSLAIPAPFTVNRKMCYFYLLEWRPILGLDSKVIPTQVTGRECKGILSK